MEGLAHVMTYGNGEGNTITHYYDRGSRVKKKPKKKKKVKNGKAKTKQES